MRDLERLLHRAFACASLGFVLISAALPFPARAGNSNNTAVKREAASSQFARAEELRAALNNKPPEQRTLAEYKRVVAGYQRVYLITPHAAECSEALLAIAELNMEMGDRFGRAYYQAAADAYTFLLREYPKSKYAQDAMLRLAKLQKDQLGDLTASIKTYQDFSKKYPSSAHRREVQEALAELVLRHSAETGAAMPPPSGGAASGATSKTETPVAEVKRPASGGAPARTVSVPRLQKIRTNVTADSTEVIVDLEDSVQYVSGRIANPDRIYFDLRAARLSTAVTRGNVRVSGNLLSQVRVSQYQAGVVRVVLEVNGVRDYAASLTKKPTRLIIELYSTTRKTKSEAVETAKAVKTTAAPGKELPEETLPAAAGPMAPEHTMAAEPPVAKPAASSTASTPANASTSTSASAASPEPRKGSLVRSSTAKSGAKPDLVQPATTPQPTRDGNSTLTRALGLKIGRIVIDAGHGGHDTGTIGPTGLMEKDLCLDVALRLGKIAQQKLPGADVVYTRSDDTFVPLEDRTRIANEARADLFISIHANSSPDHAARGVETYYLNLKGSPEAMEVAARENAVGQESVHDLEDLVKKITRTEKIDESKEFAEDVQDSLSKRIQRTATMRNRGVRRAPFVVLIGADMPSILTEISFLSNSADEQLLKKPEHRQRIAEGVFAGVAAYLQSLNSVALNTSTRPNHTPVVPTVEQSRNQK